jgi:adenine-specific DNA-methyltransferase
MENSGQYDEQGNRLVQNSESNGRFHTDWLNMIYPRLKLAKDLLSDDGVIFISIDDNEIDNMKKVCNEVFGENNLVAEIPWQSRASVQNDTDFSVNHEYICVYAKNRRQTNRRLKETNYIEWLKRDSFVCKPLTLDKEKYSNPDNDPRGPWKADPFDAPHIRPNLTYPIINPNTGDQHLPPSGRCWRISPEKFSSALADNRIIWTNNGNGRPQLKVFYNEKKDFGSVDNSWFSAEKIGTSTNGTKELMRLFNGTSYFDTPKPISLLIKLITLANTADDSIILDFFSGSATTAHAVMQLNAEDGGHRKFIMVQLPEKTDEKSEAYKAG